MGQRWTPPRAAPSYGCIQVMLRPVPAVSCARVPPRFTPDIVFLSNSVSPTAPATILDEVIESSDEDRPLRLLGHLSTPISTSKAVERIAALDEEKQSDSAVGLTASHASTVGSGKKNDAYRPSSDRNVAYDNERQPEFAAASTSYTSTASGKRERSRFVIYL